MNVLVDFLKTKIPEITWHNVVTKHGYEHIVLEVNDTWIFRQAKNEDVQKHIATEVALLKALEGKITCAIPHVSYYFPEIHCFGYKKIAGIPLTTQLYTNFTEKEKTKFADDFAQFLYELHTSLTMQEAKQIGLTAADWPLKPDVLKERLSTTTDAELKMMFEEFIPLYENLVSSAETITLLHNDLHGDNILIDPITKRITGIIDFTGASFDNVYHEFRYLHLIDIELIALAVNAYNQKSGKKLTIRNAYIYSIATGFSRLTEILNETESHKYIDTKQRITVLQNLLTI